MVIFKGEVAMNNGTQPTEPPNSGNSDKVGLTTYIPGMKPGHTKRNVLVAIVYFGLPILIPFVLAYAFATNRAGIADEFDSVPGVGGESGLASGLVAFVVGFVLFGIMSAVLPWADAPEDTDDEEIEEEEDLVEAGEEDAEADEAETGETDEAETTDENRTDEGGDDPPPEEDVDETDTDDTDADAAIETEGEPDAEAEQDAEPVDSEEADEDESEETEVTEVEEAPEEDEDEEEDLPEEDQEPDVVDSAAEAEGALEVTDKQVEGDDPEDEYIELTNVGDVTLDMSDWTVRDREEHGVVDGQNFDPVTFPSDFQLEPDETVRIVTAEGEDTDDTVHWGYGTQNWHQDGDVIIVLDGDEDEVLRHEYGDPPEE
jgi:hypothetical protein